MRRNRFDNAVLLIDKPAGRTSFDTIACVKRLLSLRKIGHSGTLDKFASGLLVVCTGIATKLTRFFLESSKVYEGEVKLGVVTDTCDIEGKIVETRPVSGITADQISSVISKFKGKLLQFPPEYSALKIKGRRASDLVREGKEVNLKGREVEIYRIEILEYGEKPGILTINVHCSKGTYIRALARDMGEELGCGAHLSGLRRLASGNFNIAGAVTLDELKEIIDGREINKEFIINPVEALKDFGSMIIGETASERVMNGAYFSKDDIQELHENNSGRFAVMDSKRNLIAVADINVTDWDIKYLNIFKGTSNN